MNILRTPLRIAALLSGLILPTIAHASLDGIITQVAGPLASSPFSGSNLGDLYANIMILLVGVVDVVGVTFIARAGLSLILKQGEDEVGKAKKTIGAIAAALILINLAPVVGDALSGMGQGAAGIISDEILGVVDFFTVVAGVIAVIVLIVSGIRAVTSYGGEDGWTALRRSIFATISGVILIGARSFIEKAVVTERNPSQIIKVIVTILNIVLGFGAFVATVVIIYAGFMMIVNIGSEDRATKAKNLVIRVAIGLIIILAALTIVNFVIAR